MIDVFAMIPAFVLGWMVVRFLGRLPLTIELPLGIGVGAAISSAIFFLLTWAGIASRGSVLCVEGALVVALGAGLYFTRRFQALPREKSKQPAWIWALRIAAAIAIVIAGMDFAQSITASPDGGYDASAIWNLRARYLAGGQGSWRYAVNNEAAANHPGYPLLVSAFIARTWTVIGDMRSSTPAVVSGLFTLSTLAVLFGTLMALASEAIGWLAMLVLIATEGYISQAAVQYADVPLSLFILASVAVLSIASAREWPPPMLALAGICASAAAWTKNEGLPFVLLILIVALWRGGVLRTVWVAIGAAAFVIVTFAMKSLVQGTESMFPPTIGQITKMLVDPSRWPEILASFGKNFWELGPPWAHPFLLLAIAAWALGFVKEPRTKLWLFAAPVGLLAVDCGIYLITMSGLTWHLQTSNNRVIAQVWPALVFAFCSLLNSPRIDEAKPSKRR